MIRYIGQSVTSIAQQRGGSTANTFPLFLLSILMISSVHIFCNINQMKASLH